MIVPAICAIVACGAPTPAAKPETASPPPVVVAIAAPAASPPPVIAAPADPLAVPAPVLPPDPGGRFDGPCNVDADCILAPEDTCAPCSCYRAILGSTKDRYEKHRAAAQAKCPRMTVTVDCQQCDREIPRCITPLHVCQTEFLTNRPIRQP